MPDLYDVISKSSDACSKEPIHLPGAIQPHGFLVGLDADCQQVLTRSRNCEQLMPLAQLHAWLLPAVQGPSRGRTGEWELDAWLPDGGHVNLHCFRSGAAVFCEFELPVPTPAEWSMERQVDAGMRRIVEAGDIHALAQTLSDVLRELTGFERVMVYRFSDDGDGDVVGESLVDSWDQSFLGLRFPASDIPAQARALYARTTARWMPTRDYPAVPLEPASYASGEPFDLSLSHFRDVSPVHRLYQSHIGTDGSMSVSVMHEQRLWGLLIGHHRQPHRVPAEIRRHVVQLVQAFALRLDGLSTHSTVDTMQREDRVHLELITRLAASENVLVALTAGSPNISDLFPHSLGVAVVWKEGGVLHSHTSGATPSPLELAQLMQWVDSQGERALFASDHLQAVYPQARSWTVPVAGLLIGRLNDERQPTLFVFKPEIIRTVSWAGRPEKASDAAGAPLLPRRSFDRWVETQRDRAAPWTPREMQVAKDIVNAINEVLLRQLHRLASIQSAYESAVVLSHTDGLLQIANRRYFDESLAQHLSMAKRAQYPIGLLMIDIDDFKAFNDLYGHVAGDRCLVQVAATVAALVNRKSDVVARYGGEELVCLLPDSDLEGVARLGRAIHAAVQGLNIPHAHSRAARVLTISVGGISVTPSAEMEINDLLGLVDAKLYASKAAGRNRLST